MIRKEYQFLKNIFDKKEIANSEHLKSLENYYHALVFLLKGYQVFSRHSEYPVHLDEEFMNSEYKEFISKFMPDCMTVDHLHKQIKEFKTIRSKNATSKQKAFALMYTRYIDFPVNSDKEKKIVSPCFFRDISNGFFYGHKVIHHSHITRGIYGYAHNFCNKTVTELADESDQYFSCVFHNGFRFDMIFLTKGIWLSLWKTQDVFLLGSGLTTLKFYTICNHVKFIDSIKYYQQPLSKLARSTKPAEKKRIFSLFLDYLGFQHPYNSTFFLHDLLEEDRTFVLDYLCSGKGCFPHEIITGFTSLSVKPDDGDFWSIETFYSRLRDEGISQKVWEGCRELYKILRMTNLSDFNDIYKIQDVYVLGVILECRWQKIKESTGFNQRRFTFASTLTGAIERAKSKVILTYPRNMEMVDLMKKLLSGVYSSVHTRLGFDTEMFTPKSKEYFDEKDQIVDNLRNL